MAMMAAVLLGVVFLGVLIVVWVTSDGYTLTVEKPTGGSVLGRYISCGSIGSDCETTIAPGDVVELQAQPDDGYVLVAYSGDCAPVGRVVMDGPRKCAVQFRAVDGPTVERHRLTIEPPTGGTIYSQEGDIACGTSGEACVAEIEHGRQVTFADVADDGFRFRQFTGACAGGSATMTGPLTCGAVFERGVPVPMPLPVGGRDSGGPRPPPGPRPTAITDGTGGGPPPSTTDPKKGQTPPVTTAGGPGVGNGPAPVPPGPALPPPLDEAPQKSPPEIARTEIARALENYRAAYSRMDVTAMKRIHPSMDVPRFERQFRDLRAVDYSLAGPPELSDLDLRAGTVRAQVAVKIVMDHKAGGKQEPVEHKPATFVMTRVGESAVWTIQQIIYPPR